VVSAKASVKAWQDGLKLSSLLVGRDVPVEKPIGVNAGAAVYDNRRRRNPCRRPTTMGLLRGRIVDVAPEAANGLDALVIGVTRSGPRANPKIDVGPLALAKLSQISVEQDGLAPRKPARRTCDTARLLALRGPTLDESELNKLVRKKEGFEKTLELLTAFWTQCGHGRSPKGNGLSRR
jgi:hypothetical protein